ncbi:1-phosphatidylinositol-3-phosphate 5-kinase FAB1 [Termitomyces sp. J132]|nr:1-phosphatidylinositol-3-phosphate 5-kinase FAB1 [Termitomyces sp. J132]
MVDYKPLPALPAQVTLYLDARQHRGQLIRAFISEIHDPLIESRREAWVYVFEEALDELGKALSQGKWLEGVRRAKEQKREAQRKEKERDELRRQETVKTKKKHSAKAGEDAEDTKHNGEVLSVECPPSAAMPLAGVKHLFLCVAPPSSQVPLPSEDSGFDMIPSNIGCSFTAGTYALQDTETPTILFGRNEGSTAQMVGGTFTFKGVMSPHQHSRVLRLSIYIHLSLILEQHFLIDSSISLLFPQRRPPLSMPIRPPADPKPAAGGRKYTSSSFIPSSLRLRSLFPFKSYNLSRGMLSMPMTRDRERDASSEPSPTSQRSSFDFSHGFRFSILGSASASSTKQPISLTQEPEPKSEPGQMEQREREHHPPFTQALMMLQTNAGLLSTSPGVRFEPPTLITELAEREKTHAHSHGHAHVQGHGGVRKLRGDERAGLCSVLGWEGSVSGMVGSPGFVRQQGIEVLESRYVSAAGGDGEGSTQIRTARGEEEEEEMDAPLGDVVQRLVEEYGKQCEVGGWYRFVLKNNVKEGEMAKMAKKRSNLLSFGKFIELLIYSPVLKRGEPSPATCACSSTSASFNLQRHFGVSVDGSRQKNEGKHRHVVSFECSKIDDIYELHVPRLQILSGLGSVSHVSKAESGGTEDKGEGEERERRELRREIRKWWEGVAGYLDNLLEAFFASIDSSPNSDDPSKGRRELKALPRIPSMEEQHLIYDTNVDFTSLGIRNLIPTSSPLPPLPPPSPTPASSQVQAIASANSFSTSSTSSITPTPTPTPTANPLPPTISTPTPSSSTSSSPTLRLSTLRQYFHLTEQSLYAQLGQTHEDRLNDVRRAFMCAARGAERRLDAWQSKYLRVEGKNSNNGIKKEKEKEGSLEWKGSEEPGWWKAGWHVLPGSSVIVDEKDWGSIIAFTLSAADYQHELNHISVTRQPSSTQLHTQHQPSIPILPSSHPQAIPIDNIPTPSTHSNHSFFAAMKLFSPSSNTAPNPDPDTDDPSLWTDPEELFSAVVSRKEHPKDSAAGLLAIREVLRGQRSPAPLHVSGSGSGVGAGQSQIPVSAWAKPDVGITKDEADGVVSLNGEGSEAGTGAAERMLQSFECETGSASGNGNEKMSRPVSRAEMRESVVLEEVSGSASGEKGLESGVEDGNSVKSDMTVGKGGMRKSQEIEEEDVAPSPPPKDERHIPQQERKRDVSNAGTASSFAGTLTNSLTNAVRFMFNGTSGVNANVNAASNPASTRSASPFSHHGLLSLSLEGATGIDDRPHIKFDWTVGKKLKFSCTVYYAKQFACLRRRCGVDDDMFLRSLRRSIEWEADGGKSRSDFWKSEDGKFVIKTLVDAWNVADLQVLIDLAPSYFRYMDATASKATVLAKMMGFYTIEIRNLETGNIQSKADLLVLENLFYHQTVSKTFDLKGIQGRKVKASNGSKVAQKSKTLFDGEWIEGQQRALILVRPHSKQVLRAAIKSDADFLAKSNIMDYSSVSTAIFTSDLSIDVLCRLLVGIDEEHKQIVCGLVDTIGSYTFAKTLEYKAKHGLKSDKEITVIPPAEYQERFVGALESYFLACPDKWSNPTDENKVISDTDLLPSVL